MSASSTTPGSVVPFGDQALLAVLGDRVDEEIVARVHALAAAVRAQRDAEGVPWAEPVPGFATLLVPYDVRRLTDRDARWRLAALLAEALRDEAPASRDDTRVVEIAVRYGGANGPDLADVARRTRLSEARVVKLHASVTYRVYLLGFVPGFAYLGALPPELELPRRESPRSAVPTGSVAVAGRQTAVYPASTPSGWHVLGRTDATLWDPAADPPTLLMPGQRVRFVPVEA